MLGISVCAASGDNGSSDGEQDSATMLISRPRAHGFWGAAERTLDFVADGKIASETVWNDGSLGGATGGGVSQHFSKPKYQAAANVPIPVASNPTGRGVPDVAGNADPATG